ncbi:beta-barrel assembly-enhancing protease [Acidihalobacter prosperus]|uniref:Peptidase M48 domain-containing protein n=1 Tax=Acidihalobacter prosperus TaxID=160660 RepID=A0A1A6C6K3_9GAMM|nr:M48 family metalloprotease [Acidihalobacter prosperus]OBS10187.1 hypothetical protein Thpro_021237 [Acidihalobacter prosperus]
MAASRQSPSLLKRWLAFLATIPLLLPCTLADADPLFPELPTLGETSSRSLTIEQERRLGHEALNEIRQKLPLLQDPITQAYLDGLGARLLANARHVRFDFRFLIIDDPAINAFAAPGGIIAINTGLIKATRNESELAAVIAHEIAHVTQRHLARSLEHGQQFGVPSLLVALGAILAGIHDPALGQAALASTVAGNAQRQLNFSRANEREADDVGMRILAESGLDPAAMAHFFATLSRSSHTDEGKLPALLLTHPATGERIAESAARAAQYGGRYRDDSLRFALFKARISALTTPPDLLIEAYADTPPHATDAATRYRTAIAMLRAGQTPTALMLLRALHRAYPNDTMLTVTLADALSSAGRGSEAITLLRRLDELYPEQTLVVTSLANAMLSSGDADEAYALLARHTRYGHDQATTLHLLARAAAAAGHPATSHEALARYYAKIGDFAAAKQQIEITLQQNTIDETARARLLAEKARIEQAARLAAME